MFKRPIRSTDEIIAECAAKLGVPVSLAGQMKRCPPWAALQGTLTQLGNRYAPPDPVGVIQASEQHVDVFQLGALAARAIVEDYRAALGLAPDDPDRP